MIDYVSNYVREDVCGLSEGRCENYETCVVVVRALFVGSARKSVQGGWRQGSGRVETSSMIQEENR